MLRKVGLCLVLILYIQKKKKGICDLLLNSCHFISLLIGSSLFLYYTWSQGLLNLNSLQFENCYVMNHFILTFTSAILGNTNCRAKCLDGHFLFMVLVQNITTFNSNSDLFGQLHVCTGQSYQVRKRIKLENKGCQVTYRPDRLQQQTDEDVSGKRLRLNFQPQVLYFVPSSVTHCPKLSSYTYVSRQK